MGYLKLFFLTLVLSFSISLNARAELIQGETTVSAFVPYDQLVGTGYTLAGSGPLVLEFTSPEGETPKVTVRAKADQFVTGGYFTLTGLPALSDIPGLTSSETKYGYACGVNTQQVFPSVDGTDARAMNLTGSLTFSRNMTMVSAVGDVHWVTIRAYLRYSYEGTGSPSEIIFSPEEFRSACLELVDPSGESPEAPGTADAPDALPPSGATLAALAPNHVLTLPPAIVPAAGSALSPTTGGNGVPAPENNSAPEQPESGTVSVIHVHPARMGGGGWMCSLGIASAANSLDLGSILLFFGAFSGFIFRRK